MVDELRDVAMQQPEEQAYGAEIRRRIAEVDAGTATLVSVDDAMARARQALKDAR